MSHKGVITVWACEWAVCLRLAMRLRPFVVVVIVIITHFNCNRLTNRYKYWILFSSRALANKEMRWSFKKSHLLRFKLELWFFFLCCKNALWNWVLCARFFLGVTVHHISDNDVSSGIVLYCRRKTLSWSIIEVWIFPSNDTVRDSVHNNKQRKRANGKKTKKVYSKRILKVFHFVTMIDTCS